MKNRKTIDALWPALLAAAQRRREGTVGALLGARSGEAPGGDWDDAALALFALLQPLLELPAAGPAWAIGQLGQSLDGCVATHSGDSSFVNGPQVLEHLHRLRALSDAVLIGAGTATLDNPRLTTRRVSGPNPVRVVLDPALRVPASAHVFTDDAAPTLLACASAHEHAAAARWGAARVIALPAHGASATGALDLAALQAALLARGLRVLFVEGGGLTVSHFIAQGRLDRMHLSVAPVVIGAGRPGLQLPPASRMGDALRPAARLFPMGSDALWDLDLRARAT